MRVRAAALTAAFVCLGSPSLAQPGYAPPRTSDGHPDISGVWTHEEGRPIEREDHSAPDAPRPLIVDPAAGKLPLRDRAAAMAWREKYARYMLGASQPDFTEGPDSLPNRDRCLMAANAAAPPMTSQGYNDAYQIVQTPGVIAISVEMMHETRIVRMVANAAAAARAHRPDVLQLWTGDSVGWWEAASLVVETTGVRAAQGAQSAMPLTSGAKILERFTRVADDVLLYRAEVTDPTLYTQPWSIESRFTPADRLWEYACHEGNYGMPGILSGARRTERDAVSASHQ